MGDFAGGLFWQARCLAQSLRDLLDFPGLGSRSKDRRLCRQVVSQSSLRVQLLSDFELLSGFGMGTVEDRSQLMEVVRRPAIELQVFAAFDVWLALGDFVGGDSW